MYAVVTTGGKQYRVAEGDVLRVEKIDQEVGGDFELGAVNFIAKGDDVFAGPDALGSAKVTATITGHGKRKKIRVFKYKRRKNYRRTAGHRQQFTEIKIKSIET